jgi:hypothetical protein
MKLNLYLTHVRFLLVTLNMFCCLDQSIPEQKEKKREQDVKKSD